MPSKIVLTGSTGNLGAYLLDVLLSDPAVEQIVCLNRATDAEKRQNDACITKGLTETLDSRRLQFIRTDITAERLGLPQELYTTLAETTDIFIHNAWPVDFNRNVSSFAPFTEGVNHLVEFCMATRFLSKTAGAAKLVFISSIGATSNWGSTNPSRSHVPELEITDWRVARTGYGQSKLLSERLLCHAASCYSLPIAIIRVGQLCGSVCYGTQGQWPEQEWIPSTIKSSITLQSLPQTLGPTEVVDWVPVDTAARVIAEIAALRTEQEVSGSTRFNRRKGEQPQFYHIVNPRTSQWTDLVPAMRERMPEDVKVITFVDWVDLLKSHVNETGGLQKVMEGQNPAGKLIDFFDNLQDRAIRFPHARSAQLETVQTLKVSPTLRDLAAVNPEWIDLWMRQWNWDGTVKSVQSDKESS